MIQPEEFYSVTKLMEMAKLNFFPIKSRTTLLRLITEGKIKAVNKSRGSRTMWSIRGQDIIQYLQENSNDESTDSKGKETTSEDQEVHKETSEEISEERKTSSTLQKTD